MNVLSMFRLLKTFLDVIKNPAQSSIDVNKFITHLSLIVSKYEKTHIYVFSSSSKKHKLFALCTPSHAYVVSYDYLTCWQRQMTTNDYNNAYFFVSTNVDFTKIAVIICICIWKLWCKYKEKISKKIRMIMHILLWISFYILKFM